MFPVLLVVIFLLAIAAVTAANAALGTSFAVPDSFSKDAVTEEELFTKVYLPL